MLNRETVKKMIEANIEVLDDDVWAWTGQVGKNYGLAKINGTLYMAHRLSFWLENEDFPPKYEFGGLELDHVINPRTNKPFPKIDVNPAHLEAVTRAENARRAYGNFTGKSLYKECSRAAGTWKGLTPAWRAKQREYDAGRRYEAKELQEELLNERT